jgi:hypothetical protein
MAQTSGKGSRGIVWALVALVVVFIIVAGVGWGLFLTKKATLSTADQANIITAYAFKHWNAIGLENLTQTMSQYSSNAVLYWYVKYTPYDTAYNAALNGTYKGTSAIQAVWSKFFGESVVYFWVNKLTVKVSGSTATVTAIAWYIVSNGTVNQSAPVSSQLYTLIMPYELYYQNINGSWKLTAEWWGFPNDQGSVIPGAYGLEAFLHTF